MRLKVDDKIVECLLNDLSNNVETFFPISVFAIPGSVTRLSVF